MSPTLSGCVRGCLDKPECFDRGRGVYSPVQRSRRRSHGLQHPSPHVCRAAASQSEGGFGESVKRIAKQVQGALPIVGLLSRLATPEGGIGFDELSYPEFCRRLYDTAGPAFVQASQRWQEKFGKAGQVRYISLYLWMARTGSGLVPAKFMVTSARRLRVTQDIEIEMERFEGLRTEQLKEYKYVARPEGKLQETMESIVDSLCRLSCDYADGEPLPDDVATLLPPLILPAFADKPGAAEALADAISQRPQRSKAYL